MATDQEPVVRVAQFTSRFRPLPMWNAFGIRRRIGSIAPLIPKLKAGCLMTCDVLLLRCSEFAKPFVVSIEHINTMRDFVRPELHVGNVPGQLKRIQ